MNTLSSSTASPAAIASEMTGTITMGDDGRTLAFLPSPKVQNHAAFVAFRPDGTLDCAWFGGTLEGKSDISIFASALVPDDAGPGRWHDPEQLSDDPNRSEQNPVLFHAPDGRVLLFHTAQPGGNQDECVVRMRELSAAPGCPLQIAGPARTLDLPRGCFVRAPVTLRDDGAWMLPVFRCNARPGQRWTGSHDTSAVAISWDAGATWKLGEDVPSSTGSVHMTIVPIAEGRLAAFYRRRQADWVHRSESTDGGRSWTAPEPTDVPNNNSSIGAIRLRDGRVALIGNLASAATSTDRRKSLYDELGETDARPDADSTGGCTPIWGVPRAPLALCLSEDGGRSFPWRRIVEGGPGTCLSNDSLDGRNRELSYPMLVEAADGALHLAYTFHRRAIRHVRLPPDWTRGGA
jgi:predicted neuraminidase